MGCKLMYEQRYLQTPTAVHNSSMYRTAGDHLVLASHYFPVAFICISRFLLQEIQCIKCKECYLLEYNTM